MGQPGRSGLLGKLFPAAREQEPVEKGKTAVGVDVCDYPMARNLIVFAVALACEAIVRYVVAGEQENYSFTLGDLAINRK